MDEPSEMFFKYFKWYKARKVKMKSLSRVQFFATVWTVAYQAPPSIKREENAFVKLWPLKLSFHD